MAVFLIILMIVLVGADQAVKYWAATELQPVGSIDFISVGGKKLVDLTYLENRGAIFGSMQGQRWFLIGFTSLVLIIGFVLLFKFMKRSKLLALAITLFIAGGIGNHLASTASGMSEAGSAAVQTTGPMLAAAKSFMMIGAGLLLTAAAFALLAQSAIALAGAGAPAIAVMAGLMAAAIAWGYISRPAEEPCAALEYIIEDRAERMYLSESELTALLVVCERNAP